MSAKPIMILHPDVATNPVKQVLRRAGYAVVVSDRPDLFTSVEVMPVATAGLVYRAALATVKSSTWDSVRQDFGKRVAEGVLTLNEST